MYNFMLAFLICCVSYIIGEMVSNLTKAWVPSVFVSAVVMLLGYWTVFPHDLVTNAGLIPFGSTICCYLQVAQMGTIISIRLLAVQAVESDRYLYVRTGGNDGTCIIPLPDADG